MARIAWLLGVFAALVLAGCREEGTAEKAGKKLDEVVEKLQHPNEGTLERLGRKTDEALDDVKETLEEAAERE